MLCFEESYPSPALDCVRLWSRFMALSLAFGLFGLVCYAAIQLALQLRQERIQVVRSTKVVRRIPTKSNGTPAKDLGHKLIFGFWFVILKVFIKD